MLTRFYDITPLNEGFNVISDDYFIIYILLKENKPVYVGRTQNIKNRISNHKHTKKGCFDSYIELIRVYDYTQAALIEMALIMSYINTGVKLINKQTPSYLKHIKEFKV